MMFNSYSYEILCEQFHWIYLQGDIKLLLVSVNNRLKFEIEIVHDLSCHPIVVVVVVSWYLLVIVLSLFWDEIRMFGVVAAGPVPILLRTGSVVPRRVRNVRQLQMRNVAVTRHSQCTDYCVFDGLCHLCGLTDQTRYLRRHWPSLKPVTDTVPLTTADIECWQSDFCEHCIESFQTASLTTVT